MNIALTGANGSIGRELTPFLKGLGHNIYTISSSVQRDGERIFSYADLFAKTINVKIDIFFHLATINSQLSENEIGLETQLTKNILSSLPSLNCKKLIFLSSAKVYGDNTYSSIIFDEKSPLNPLCSYGKAKKLCEELIQLESPNLGIYPTIFRLPPVLNQSYDSGLGKLIRLSRFRIPIPILYQGFVNQRSFLSFNNFKETIHFFLENEDLLSQNEIYNVSDNEFISLSQLLLAAKKCYLIKIPLKISELFFKIPFLSSFLLRLYGNFELNNSKLEAKMNVKLKTTNQSLPRIYS